MQDQSETTCPNFTEAAKYALDNQIQSVANAAPNQQLAHLLAEQWGKEKQTAKPPVKIYRVGRNDACPCQSGKKFKRCCMSRIKAITQDSQDKLRAIQEATAAENQPEQDKIDKATPVNLRNPTARNLRRAIKKMNRKQ